MSEQKDPNEINFDDEFLDINFGNEVPANSGGNNANLDADLADLDAIFNQSNQSVSAPADVNVGDVTLSDINLSDVNLNSNVNLNTDNLSDDDFFNQLDSLNQAHLTNPPAVEPTATDTGISGAEAAALGATVTALGTATTGSDKEEKKVAPKSEKKGFSFGGLFGKKDSTPKAPKAPKPPKPAKAPKAPKTTSKLEKAPKAPKPAGAKTDLSGLMADPKKLNKLILVAVLALLLIGLALYMLMGQEEELPPAPPPPAKTAPAKPATPPAPKSADNTATAEQGKADGQDKQQGQQASQNPQAQSKDNKGQATAPAPKGGEVLPEIKPVVSPEEILNAPTPTDPALIKEEIDRLNDKGNQIVEQEKIIKEQLVLMEDLTTAKAEQIALLEKQIAELEKKKNATTTAPANNKK